MLGYTTTCNILWAMRPGNSQGESLGNLSLLDVKNKDKRQINKYIQKVSSTMRYKLRDQVLPHDSHNELFRLGKPVIHKTNE